MTGSGASEQKMRAAQHYSVFSSLTSLLTAFPADKRLEKKATY